MAKHGVRGARAVSSRRDTKERRNVDRDVAVTVGGDEQRQCWCGGTLGAPFGPHYKVCDDCGTLVARVMPAGDITRVRDDERDFYGRQYWFEHQAGLHQDNLEQRSQRDVHERCLHWLRALLRYCQPPARALEVGSAHGGFVHLLQQAGYEATGLELSPWVVAFAQRTFDIPMLLGPLEDQDLEPGTFDLLIAMDVLEHLPDPRVTIGRAAGLLGSEGVLMIQTPCRPAERGHDELVAHRHRFLEMLLPDEHLYLYTEQALRTLLARHGLTHSRFEPAMFDHYDMMVFASRRELKPRSPSSALASLVEGPQSRNVAAMLALYQDYEASQLGYAQADADRVGRQAQIDALKRESAEQKARLERRIDRLRPAMARLRLDRRRERQELDRQQAVHAGLIDARDGLREQHDRLREEHRVLLKDHLALQERDAALRTDHQKLGQALAELRVTHQALDDAHQALRKDRQAVQDAYQALHDAHEAQNRQYQEILALREEDQKTLARGQDESDRLRQQRNELGARVELQERLHSRAVALFVATVRTLGEVTEDRDAGRERHDRDAARGTHLEALVGEYRTGRLYRALVRSGRWQSYDERLQTALAPPALTERMKTAVWSLSGGRTVNTQAADSLIAIDLTAVRPGGVNGGAGLVAHALSEALIRQQPSRSWLLLTTEENHHLFEDLEALNARCHCIVPEPSALAEVRAEMAIGLLFCPMTSPPFRDPSVPLVSVVYDLQYLSYPLFFDADERRERDRHFRHAIADSERIVTISEYVRRTVLDHTEMPAERVVTAKIGLSKRLPRSETWSDDQVASMLAERGLTWGRYLFYPANIWPHKNHRMLLVALGIARHRRPDLDMKLVLTGADQPDPAPLTADAEAMGLGTAVVFAGYVPEAELDGLYRGCRALVFPSLYEGFGMPLLEAMARDRPVLCSNVTALPEVVGDAGLLFDPRIPEALAEAMVKIVTDDTLAGDLVNRGRERLRMLGDTDGMAAKCFEVMVEVLNDPPELVTTLVGVHADAWTGRHFSVTFGPGEAGRYLRCDLVSPYGTTGALPLTVRSADGRHKRLLIYRHRPLVFEAALPTTSGRIDFTAETSFQPSMLGLGNDPRHLGVKVECCRLDHADGTHLNLLATMGELQ